MKKNNLFGTKLMVTITFIAMILANAAAVLLPVNGLTTQEVSDKYANLFAPAGITFSIWSIIYLFVAGFTIYFWKDSSDSVLANKDLKRRLGILVIISSILNSIWLFAWQYLFLSLSVIIMLALLVTLIIINLEIGKYRFNTKEYILVRLPFSIYFGWITVATIANITAFVVSKNITLFQDHQVLWTIIILLVGLVIAGATILKNKNIAYGLTVIWAYAGILIKHQSSSGWNKEYPAVSITVMICLVALIVLCLTQVYLRFKTSNDID
ncbi:tryptophan-rich sensory protein [Enterococcus sp. LJL99]